MSNSGFSWLEFAEMLFFKWPPQKADIKIEGDTLKSLCLTTKYPV